MKISHKHTRTHTHTLTHHTHTHTHTHTCPHIQVFVLAYQLPDTLITRVALSHGAALARRHASHPAAAVMMGHTHGDGGGRTPPVRVGFLSGRMLACMHIHGGILRALRILCLILTERTHTNPTA